MLRERSRWVVLVLLAIGVPWALYSVLDRMSDAGPSAGAGQFLLPTLSLTLVVLTLGLAGVLIRNLVKLIVERKRGILGSKLRIKLVFFYLALVLVPALILFTGSAQVIKRTVEAILRTPLEELSAGQQIVDQWTESLRARSLRRANALAEELRNDDLRPARRTALSRLLEDRREQEDLQLIQLYVNGRLLARAEGAIGPELREPITRHADRIVNRAAAERRPVAEIATVGAEVFAQAAVPFDARAPGADARTAVVAISLRSPPSVAEYMQNMSAVYVAYRQFRVQRRHLVRFYLTLIGLIFIATLFVATWIGFYVARKITVPIEEVAAASREISAGNLNVRVHTQSGDEMGMLVDAFNEMAAELQENREVITRSTADLRQSNLALDERRRYIETLVANLSTAVISLDPAGRVTTSNPAVEKMLGAPLRTGSDAVLALKERDLGPLADLLEQALESEETVRRDLELTGVAPTRQLTMQVSPLKGRSDEDLGTLIMIEDLSDLLRAQKALAWQDVARRLAHEIKNPLTPIQLSAQRLRKKFFARSEDLDEVLLEATASIEHEVGGLMQLVDEFSRFARMPEIEATPVNLATVVESVLSLYRGLPGIEWQVEQDESIDRVRVDAQQIRRVLINLIDNAIAASAGHGTVRIATRALGKDALRIEVADSGPGIRPKDRDKMFAPYFSTKKRGTGLGLAIVHKIVTDHRGTIRVEDNDPRGARFVIVIPT